MRTAGTATQVQTVAKGASRLLVGWFGGGIETDSRKQQEFFDVAERFGIASIPEEVKRLGNQMAIGS